MDDLDEQTVIEAGGWDCRYAAVRAVGTLGDRAAAVVDANGDGADINLDFFHRAGVGWELLSSSGGAGDWGRSWHDGLWAEHDRDEDGWSLTLTPGSAPADEGPVLPPGSFGWYAATSRRRWPVRPWRVRRSR